MKLICPGCYKLFDTPDFLTGKSVNCTFCGYSFTAPEDFSAKKSVNKAPAPSEGSPTAATNLAKGTPVTGLEEAPKPSPTQSSEPLTYGLQEMPAVAPPASQAQPTPAVLPELASPSPSPLGSESIPASSAPKPIAPPQTYWLTLNLSFAIWIPGIALSIAFLLTFFRWAGLYPADYPAYTQNAWQALTAGLSKDPVAEDHYKMEKDLRARLESNWWLLPYLPLLILTMLLALAGPILKRSQWKLPNNLEKFWPYRPALLVVLSVVLLLLLVIQWSNGFGINQAVVKDAQIKNHEAMEKANTPEKIQRIEMDIAKDWGGKHPQTTTWLRLAVLAHIVATLGAFLEGFSYLRGNKPPPKIGIEW